MARSRKCKLIPKKTTSLRNPSLKASTHSSPLKAKKKPRPLKSREKDEADKDIKCSICLDTTRCRKMKTLFCKHKFHERCINMCLEIRPNCPLCRAPCGRVVVHQNIFEEFLENGQHERITNTIIRHMLLFTFQAFGH